MTSLPDFLNGSVGFMSALLCHGATAAEPAATAIKETPVPGRIVRPTAEQREEWRQSILKTPKPGKGCYTAVYPEKEWREVACGKPSNKLYPPRRFGSSMPTEQVGDGPDFSAVVTGHITVAEGSFDPGTTVTSECSVPCPIVAGVITCPATPSCGASTANHYSLQLNSKPFDTSVCSGSPFVTNGPSGTPVDKCQGWEQFVYPFTGGGSIQYWLEDYGPAGTMCPTPRGAHCVAGSASLDGWCPFQFTPTGPVYCVVNAAMATSAPPEPISSLPGLKLRGSAAGVAGSTTDEITVTIASGPPLSAPGGNYFPDLGSQWQEAEFNVFGDGNGDQAVFASGTNLVVRTAVDSGVTTGPGCDFQSFTGESNNLNLVNMPPTALAGSMPALVFSETNAAQSPVATCADATSIGDTHLTTFDGVHYDFQASGDFVLAQLGNEFAVHTRQALAVTDPNWIKNATINKAVAAQMGKDQVELYIWPVKLVANGRTETLTSGKTISLANGTRISLKGNVYTMMSPQGDSVTATVNNNGKNQWMDVRVGLRRGGAGSATGLLGSPTGSGLELRFANGTALRTISFVDLYHGFADGWRVAQGKSLLATARETKVATPEKPLFASDLDEKTAARARATCAATGVVSPALLDDCMLDVAILGDETAAKVYSFRIPPRMVLARPTLQ
jgi:von Willebrand factor type D domain